MLKPLYLSMITLLLVIHGCRQEDQVLLSWNQFVNEAESGEANFIQELSADMKHHGYSYELYSSEFHPETATGSIELRVTPPVGDWYYVDFEFQQEGDTWTNKKGFKYREQSDSEQN